MKELEYSDSMDSSVSIGDRQNYKTIDREELAEKQELIRNQYEDLENLGVDYLKDFDIEYKKIILEDMFNFVDKHYLTLTNYDNSLISSEMLIKEGEKIYKFICIDCYLKIIPSYLEKIKCKSIEEFDNYFNTKLQKDSSNFKTDILKNINDQIEKLLNLKEIDITVERNKNYQTLLNEFYNYSTLINNGNSDKFLFNYFREIIIKNIQEIIERIL